MRLLHMLCLATKCNIVVEMLLRDAAHVGVEVASISLAEIEQQERALEGGPIIQTVTCCNASHFAFA
jgi:hypothetical protein